MDVALTELGRRQARVAADRLGGSSALGVVSSDLLRAVQTAEVIAARVGVDVRVDAAWREQGLGVLEGALRADAWSRLRGERWSADWRPDGGESTRDVYRRIAGFFSEWVPGSVNDELVVVTHGDTLRIALGLVEGVPPEAIPWMMAPNGAVVSRTIARTEAGSWRVVDD